MYFGLVNGSNTDHDDFCGTIDDYYLEPIIVLGCLWHREGGMNMPTRDIVCLNCGFAGILDIYYENDVATKDALFKHLGHNPYSGDLHYRCPDFKIILRVDPMAVLGEDSLNGFPVVSSVLGI